MENSRKSVFVSYAHVDRRWADDLLKHMAPWIREKRVKLWDDSQIEAGENWKREINLAIRQASVAVLLVTKDFLASKFIMEEELPRILRKAKKDELRIIWVAVGHAAYDMSPLISFQAANDPEAPLSLLKPGVREKKLTEIARKIGNALTVSSIAGGLGVIDETAEPLEAIVEKREENPSPIYGVEAVYKPSSDSIRFVGASTTITADDIEKLPEDDREFIADLEDELTKNYKRWRKVKTSLGNAGGGLDDEINGELLRISKLICADLNHILEFLRNIHKAELEDHYGRYRYICLQLNQS